MKIKSLLMPFALLTGITTPVITISSCSKEVKVESISLTLSKSKVDVGDEVKLDVKVLPENATNKNVDISINNISDFYTSEAGVIVPYKAGTYTITAKAKDGSGKTDSKNLVVNPEQTTTESWADYANDRTFSLMVTSPSSINPGFGTGWILSDATPSILDDYQYYVATNWHVVNGIRSSSLDFSVACGDAAEAIPYPNYIKIDGTAMDEDNFLHGGDTINVLIKGQPVTALQCCDFYVVKMDLKNVKSSSSPCADIITNKLNKLNNLTAQGKKITNIAPIASDSHNYQSLKNFYTLGYPYDKNVSCAKRESHNFELETIDLYYDGKNSLHDLENKSLKYNKVLVDCSPQYVSQTSVASTWMTGGASGSMLLGDFGPDATHHIYKVCGIYWGIFKDGGCFPSYSIFNSDYKNFVSNFY